MKLRFFTPAGLIIATALFMTIFDNHALFKALIKISSGPGFIVAIAAGLTAFFASLLAIVSHKYLLKPLIAFTLILSATISFFMDHYGVIFDQSMIKNIMETDSKEALDLLSFSLIATITAKGILPAALAYRINLRYRSFTKELLSRLVLIILAAVTVIGFGLLYYKDLSLLGRSNRHLRYLVNPTYPIYALGKYINQSSANKDEPLRLICEDAKQPAKISQGQHKPTLVVLVVGEAARAKNFSLNGYSRDTNPHLIKQPGLINFPNTHSCGTATAASVPCMFSIFPRKQYKDSYGRRYESLLDVLKRAGVSVLWRDNNSSCKGACDRVETESMEGMNLPEFCGSDECFDEVMLHKLQEYVGKQAGDMVIVLHQKGSHGPAYHKRSPANFKQFTPECTSNAVQECSQQEIINAYDNTLLYTDHFLAQVIEFLKQNSSKYSTAMWYMSDHGESLGENGIYLHGLPYMIAPGEQIHIPFVLWMSDGLAKTAGIDPACLKQHSSAHYSHDNLFHSMLGLLRVRTAGYDKKLDVFAGCRMQNSLPDKETN